jgi:hypothetical protein
VALRRIGASLLTLTLIASGCANLTYPRPPRPGRCDRSLSCPIVTTELSLERRTELALAIEERMADRSLIAVAYDGKHLRMQPECRIVGEYTWRQAGLERRVDSDSAVFVVEEPHGIDGYVRMTEPHSASFRATRRVTLPTRPGPMPDDPACSDVTHVVEGLILGVDPDAGEHAQTLPVVLMLDVLHGDPPPGFEPPPPPPRERPPKQAPTPRTVGLWFAGVAVLIASITLGAVVPEDEF